VKELFETIERLFAQLRTEFQARVGEELARSDRAKVLLVAVAGILLISLTIACGATAASAKRENRAAQVAYARLKAQVDTGSWAERRAQSQALKLTIEERFWVGNTPGLAEAGFDRWIRDHLGRYKVEPQTIQMRRVAVVTGPADAQARDPLANVERMTAKILMPFDQTGLLGFLDDIAESEKTLVIDRLIVRAGRNARVEMDLSTFYPARDKAR
jgi:hypothetical protein